MYVDFLIFIIFASFEHIEPHNRLVEYREIGLVVNEVFVFCFVNKVGFFKLGQVIGESLRRHFKVLGELTRADFALLELQENLPSGVVG